MKKYWILFAALALMVAGCNSENKESFPEVMAVAHRGCWLKEGGEFYINENCPAGVRMARRFGYPAIECDVKYTLDSVMVIMHDKTINRTMRLSEGYAEIPEPVKVTETTFDELRTKYVLASTDPSLRLPIPTLEEELLACKEEEIIPMLHSTIGESYRLAQEILGNQWIAFCSAGDSLFRDTRSWSDVLILLDPGEDTAENTISRLNAIGGRCGMSTMKYKMLDKAYIDAVKDAGFEVQASIFKTPHEQRALRDGVTIELSDFFWSQTEGRKPYDTWKQKKVSLKAGEELTWQPSEKEFAAMVLGVEFQGEILVTLNGREYPLTREEIGTEWFGLRMYKTAPSITIKAVSDSRIASATARLYEI